MNASQFCKLAIVVLDDEQGISESAWYEIENELRCLAQEKSDCLAKDIVANVKAQDGRWFLPLAAVATLMPSRVVVRNVDEKIYPLSRADDGGDYLVFDEVNNRHLYLNRDLSTLLPAEPR